MNVSKEFLIGSKTYNEGDIVQPSDFEPDKLAELVSNGFVFDPNFEPAHFAPAKRTSKKPVKEDEDEEKEAVG